MSDALLLVEDLRVDMRARRDGLRRPEVVRVLDDVTLRVAPGETLGLVGGSGCGKTTLGLTIMGVRRPQRGRVVFDGVDVARHTRRQRKTYRRDVQMVFQDPGAALNPRMTLRQIVTEPMTVHQLGSSRASRIDHAADLLDRCGVPGYLVDRHPHTLSGGLRQRVAIARAIAASPRLVVADEPTSALDVSVQSQILRLVRDLQHDLGIAFLFVSHDLGVIRNVADRVAVMAGGRLVECGASARLFDAPRHPVTRNLLDAYALPPRTTADETRPRAHASPRRASDEEGG